MWKEKRFCNRQPIEYWQWVIRIVVTTRYGIYIALSIIFHLIQTISLNEWSSEWTYRTHWLNDKCRRFGWHGHTEAIEKPFSNHVLIWTSEPLWTFSVSFFFFSSFFFLFPFILSFGRKFFVLQMAPTTRLGWPLCTQSIDVYYIHRHAETWTETFTLTLFV